MTTHAITIPLHQASQPLMHAASVKATWSPGGEEW